MLNMRLEISALDNDQIDFYVMGLLHTHSTSETEKTLHKRESRRMTRKLPRRTYTIKGTNVCREAFHFLLCLGQQRLVALQNCPLEERPKPTLGGWRYNTKALSASDTESVIRFIESFTEEHGLCLPGRIPGCHRSNLKLLPSYYTKVRLWRTYKKAALDNGIRVVGLTSFKNLWSRHLPFIVVARPMTDLCTVCQKNNTKILYPGAVAMTEKRENVEAQLKHIDCVNVEREFYNSVVRDSKATARNLGISNLSASPVPASSRQMSIGYCFDYAQQVHIPSSPMHPGHI